MRSSSENVRLCRFYKYVLSVLVSVIFVWDSTYSPSVREEMWANRFNISVSGVCKLSNSFEVLLCGPTLWKYRQGEGYLNSRHCGMQSSFKTVSWRNVKGLRLAFRGLKWLIFFAALGNATPVSRPWHRCLIEQRRSLELMNG